MRILVATDQWFPDRLGGVARIATDTARGWAERGHEVVVIAPRHAGTSAAEQAADGALRLHRVLPRGRFPQTLSDPTATRRAARRLAGGRFDVLVAHCSTSAHGLLAARLDVPLVYVFHADAAMEARYLRTKTGLGTRWLAAAAFEGRLRRMTARALHASAQVIVLSEFSRGLLSQISTDVARGAVLTPGGVDADVFSPANREGARARLGMNADATLLFTVRRHEPRMGLENLLGAVQELDDLPGLNLVVAGGGDGVDVAALRARLGLEGRVQLVGRVCDEELALWHRAADVFVLPTVAYEGFGLVTAEALASGTPVVGTRVGATPELLEPLDADLLARGTDSTALAEAIRYGLGVATPAFRARCREYAESRLAWKTVLPEWERVLLTARQRRSEAAPSGRNPSRAPEGL